MSTPSRIASAFAMTHTPGLGNRWSEPPADQVERMRKGFDEGRRQLAASKPDLIIALINDHFDMYNLSNMPALSIAVGTEHFGPPADSEAWLEMKRRSFPGNYDYAMDIYRDSIDAGFDLSRSGSAEFVHNMLMPLRFLHPEMDLPIVPIFMNCFAPPLPRIDRAHAFGRALRKTIDRRPERICLIASGGLSHWPPYPREGRPLKDDLDRIMWEVFNHGSQVRSKYPHARSLVHEREKEMAAERSDLVNMPWDREVLRAMEQGDSKALCVMEHDTIEPVAGPGGSEVLMWAALMGAMNDGPGKTLFYEAVQPWMGGVTVFSYTAG